MDPSQGHDAGPRERALSHSSRRLQPTVLRPPPGDDGPPLQGMPYGASAEDDLDLGLEADTFARRRQLLIAAAGVAIALVGTAAFVLLGPATDPPREQAARPPVEAIPVPAPTALPAPNPTIAVTPPPPAAAAPQPSADASMGQVSGELVPPSTEGLSPARKVNAVRIVVDGDREVRP